MCEFDFNKKRVYETFAREMFSLLFTHKDLIFENLFIYFL